MGEAVKPDLIGNRWARGESDFAVRIDRQDVTGFLSKGLIIEHGTKALLFQRGKYIGELGEGEYDMGGLLKRINTFNKTVPSSVVLFDAGDVQLRVESENLFTREDITVGVRADLKLRVKDPDSFFVNMFKGSGKISLAAVESDMADEIAYILKNSVASYSVKELYGNPDLRREMEEEVRTELTVTLVRLGLEIIHLRIVDFSGEEYEKTKRERGEVSIEEEKVEILSDRAKLAQRMREILTKDMMNDFKSLRDLEDFLSQIYHELNMKDVLRDDEVTRLWERLKDERDMESLLRSIEYERVDSDARREEDIAEATTEEKIRDIEREGDEKDFEFGMRNLEKMRESKRKHEAELLQQRGQATAEALLSIVDGPQAERILEIEKLRTREKMTPEQILALTAEASPEAAKALAEKYKAENQITVERFKDLEKRMAEQQQMSEKFSDRLERLAESAMQQMGRVAESRAQGDRPTVVAGGGRPVVVGSAGSIGKIIKCSKCGTENDPGSKFCQSCGDQL